jgi:hypothetical protein
MMRETTLHAKIEVFNRNAIATARGVKLYSTVLRITGYYGQPNERQTITTTPGPFTSRLPSTTAA